MTLSTDLTQADIDAAITLNRAILQERFPDLDLSVGGQIDSLLVDGNAVVTAQNDSKVDQAYLYQQLRAVAKGVVTIGDDDLDRLMANYFITRRAATPASGTAAFIVRDNVTTTLQAGYRLRYGGQTYKLLHTYTVYPVGTTSVDFDADTNVLMQASYDDETGFGYRFELPISSIEPAAAAARVAGDRFTVDQAFDGLGYVTAVTNFQGGIAAETNAEFAARGLTGLLAETVGGPDHIRKLVGQTVQFADASAIGTGDQTMTRDRNNVFNLPTGGKMDVYVKSGAIAQAGYTVTAEVVDAAARTVKLTLSRTQSAGVYRTELLPFYTTTPPTIVSGSLTVDAVVHNTWTDSDGFNPDLPAESDRAFSARQEIEIQFTDDRQDGSGYVVDMSAGAGAPLAGSYRVETEYQPGVLDIDAALTSEASRPPGTDLLVKAAVPAITSLGVVAQRPSDYNGPSAATIEAELATAINLLPISTAQLSSFSVGALLSEIAPTLTLMSVSLNATIYGQDGTDISLPALAGKLTLPTDLTSKVEPRNTFFTTTSALVSVTLV